MNKFSRRFAKAFLGMESLEPRILYSTSAANLVTTKLSHLGANPASTTASTQSLAVGSSWNNTTVPSESSPFELAFDATPNQNDENVVIGLSNGTASAYTDLAAIVRFNPTGQIDVRNGANYQADATVNYTAGTSYQFQLDIDPTTQDYNVYVTPAGGSAILLAQNYAFRSEQSDTSTLTNLGGYGLVGSAAVTGISLIPTQNIAISSSWNNTTLASESGPFQLSFDATPAQNDENVVMGLSGNAAGGYTDLAAIVRFNPNGQIDVRNGSDYYADATVNYTAGTNYAFTMVVDPTTQTYSVYVTPDGGSQILLAQNYAFRTEQANTTTLNNFGGYGLDGAAEVTNIGITPIALGGLSATASSASEIDLSWNSTSGVQGFNILRSTDDQTFTQIGTVGATTTTYADTTVGNSTTYYYEVEAYNAAGVLSASSVGSATTPGTDTDTGTSSSSGTGTNPPPAVTSDVVVSGTLLNGVAMPGPNNTGPTDPNNLTPSGSLVITTPGTIIQNLAISGTIQIYAPDVTIENCTITDSDESSNDGNDALIYAAAGTDGLIVENCTLTGGGSGTVQIFSQANNAQFLNLNIYNTPTSVFQLSGSSTISGCWLHEIGWNGLGLTSNPNEPGFTGTDHVDDIFFETGAYLTVTGNNFDTPANTTINGINYSVSNVDIFTIPYGAGDYVGPVTVEDNYLNGGGYMFNLCGQGTTTIADNIIGSDEAYGLINGQYIGCTWHWSDNVDSNSNQISIPTGIGDILGTL
jgi:hypothetical protein